MPTQNPEQERRNLDQRLERIEQFLPTLATKEELRVAIAPLATKEELRAAIAPLATKDYVRSLAEETRRHFDVVAESLRQDIRLVAEGQVHLSSRIDVLAADWDRRFDHLDQRVLRLEAAQPRSPGR